MSIVADSKFSLSVGDVQLSQYGNKPHASHNFCRACGIHAFTRIDEPDGRKVAVNLACIESIDLDSLTPLRFNGKAL